MVGKMFTLKSQVKMQDKNYLYTIISIKYAQRKNGSNFANGILISELTNYFDLCKEGLYSVFNTSFQNYEFFCMTALSVLDFHMV